jgi:hypothetical protein
MTSDDDVFLTAFNAKRTPSNRCSEDDFEKIMEVYELAAERHTPFAAVDQTIVPFETVEIMLKGEVDKKALGFAKDIYDYWKTSRQTSSNRPLQPTLKFEMHQDSDDADPYVCFRRRDVRQTRKTRARDMQVTEKLRRLRKELEEGRQLVLMALQRERSKRDLLNVDRSIFEQRRKVKEIRQRLGIKVDDEDLVNQKVCDSPALPLSGLLLTIDSLKRRSLQRFHNSSALRVPSFACNHDLSMVVLWKQTCLLSPTYRPKERSRFNVKSMPRSNSTRSGTLTMLTSLLKPSWTLQSVRWSHPIAMQKRGTSR